ncbi:MAG: esterase-like activity of phytase family protein, partial [Saprospiraceae bacterium]|nr:esterase-like activity of phytase family protein [Saprospiraceae bacterium]
MKLYLRLYPFFALLFFVCPVFAQSPDLFAPQGFRLKKYKFDEMPIVGTHNGLIVKEGGVSGIIYQNGVFFLLSDRGPNADVTAGSAAKGKSPLLFPFPKYAPKIWQATLEGDKLQVMRKYVIKRPDNSNASGLPLPPGHGNTGEMAWSDTLGTTIPFDAWGLDAEGLTRDPNGDWWVCEEYGTSIWQLDAQFKVKKRYTPFPSQPEDVPLDAAWGKRRPNRGFEGITCTPNGKIYALLQSPANIPDEKTGQQSRLHRLLEIDPKKGLTRTFIYEHAAAQGNIRSQDMKIGDIAAINNTEFLVLEHAERKKESVKNVYKISIENATALSATAPSSILVEPLIDANTLITKGIYPVKKQLFADLTQLGWERDHDKPEGLTVMNDSTFAVINDNDFGIDAPKSDGNIIGTGKTTRLYVFTLPAD